MELDQYRKKEIEFLSLKNIITYCAIVNEKPFNLIRIAKILNTDYKFLREWTSRNNRLINRILNRYGEEIEEEKKRIKREEGDNEKI